MKRTVLIFLGLLLLAVPPAAQAQFTWVTNADNSITITGYNGPGGSLEHSTHHHRTARHQHCLSWVRFLRQPDQRHHPQQRHQHRGLCFRELLESDQPHARSKRLQHRRRSVLWHRPDKPDVSNQHHQPRRLCVCILSQLTEVCFQGNAPSAIYLPFHDDPATIYYLPGTVGWGSFAEDAEVQIAPWVPDSLEVNLNPAAAITVGAQWRVDGGTWQNSGAMVGGLTMGSHRQLQSISGWVTPADQTVFLDTNLFVVIAGPYGQETGSLQVTLTPGPAITDGAQWQVDGSAWQNSGTTSNLPVGSHTVSFSAVSGWATPVSQAVVVASNQAIFATANYAAQSQTGSLEVTISPF